MRSCSRGWLACTALVASAGLAGCGQASTATPAAPYAHQSAAQILDASRRALSRVHSFHLQGTLKDKGATVRFSGEFVLPGELSVTYSNGPRSYSLRLVGGYAYMKADAPVWVANGSSPEAVAVLADRWVKLATASAPGVASFRPLTQASTLARCTLETGGDRLGRAPDTTIDGLPVAVLRDHGNRPGSSPARLYVAAAGPALPLRMVQTGPSRPGGKPDRACGDTGKSSSTVTSGTLSFSQYDWHVHISAPADALTLGHPRPDTASGSGARGAGGGARARAPGAQAQSAEERAQEAEMEGTWLARGQVIESHNDSQESLGGTLDNRAWLIRPACLARGCGLEFSRTTDVGTLTAPLTWDDGHWTTTFAFDWTCANGARNPDRAHWTLSVHGSGLTATERTRTTNECTDQPAEAVVTWNAIRLLTPGGSGSRPPGPNA